MLLCFVFFAGGAEAHNCKCLYAGGIARQGETRCIKTSEGPRLARCGMVLNNSSWTFSKEACTPEKISRLSTPLSIAQR